MRKGEEPELLSGERSPPGQHGAKCPPRPGSPWSHTTVHGTLGKGVLVLLRLLPLLSSEMNSVVSQGQAGEETPIQVQGLACGCPRHCLVS